MIDLANLTKLWRVDTIANGSNSCKRRLTPRSKVAKAGRSCLGYHDPERLPKSHGS
jgi:hypothetical protein